MLSERQSDGQLQASKNPQLEPPLHALHPASSWQPPLRKFSPASLLPAELVTRKLLKRSRPQEEIDRFGESVSRKKRRLQRELVTSRLSRPYATPPTHISRGAWRLGVWARQRSSGGLLLRKAAILNSIAKKKKTKTVSENTKEIGVHEVNTAPILQSHPSHDPPARTQSKPPSIFTSSDYDAFDYEENEPFDDEESDDEDLSDNQSVYSDFRMLGSSDSDAEFDDASYSFDSLDTSYHLGIDHCEKAIDLVVENESQKEVSVAPGTSKTLPSSISHLVPTWSLNTPR